MNHCAPFPAKQRCRLGSHSVRSRRTLSPTRAAAAPELPPRFRHPAQQGRKRTHASDRYTYTRPFSYLWRPSRFLDGHLAHDKATFFVLCIAVLPRRSHRRHTSLHCGVVHFAMLRSRDDLFSSTPGPSIRLSRWRCLRTYMRAQSTNRSC